MTTPFVALDFETYYDDVCSVKTLGPVAYTRHPQFDAYMVSIYSPEYKFVGHPRQANWSIIKDHAWLSHNAGFDQAVYNWLQHKEAWSIWWPKQWHCTSNLAAYVGAPRDLAGASKTLLGKEKSKDMRNWMKGRTWQQAIEAGKAQAMLDYAMSDAENCWLIWDQYSKYWPETERWLSDYTYRQGERGIFLDFELLEKGIETVKEARFHAEASLPWTKEIDPRTEEPYAVGSFMGLAKTCEKAGINPPPSTSEDSEECQKWELEYNDRFPWVKNLRIHRKSNRILATLETLKERRLDDGTMTYSLKYFGAHTGRWSGDGGFNIQNLHKGDILGVDIRKILRARPGKKFVVCDLAQIEPRVLAWQVNDHELLEKVRNGFSVYASYAIARGKWEAALGDLKKENPALYAWAKAVVLGLGYGCGPDKFIIVAKMLAGLDLTLEEAKSCVREFRASNPKIVGFWNQLDEAFRSAAQPDIEEETGRLADEQDHTFHMPLPSGRVMSYRNVTCHRGFQCQVVLGDSPKWFWGGSLCENFVQATSRDVFAHGMMNLARAGIDVLFHVHDEYVCEVDKNFDKEEVVGIVTTAPKWLQGCPIGAEAIETEHYTK